MFISNKNKEQFFALQKRMEEENLTISEAISDFKDWEYNFAELIPPYRSQFLSIHLLSVAEPTTATGNLLQQKAASIRQKD